MKRIYKLACVLYAGLCLGGVARGDELARTMEAIRQVESSGGRNTRDGDHGRAIGDWQIHRAYWTDGTAALGVTWPYSDARNDTKARQVVRAYLRRYAPKGAGPEQWARMHNGGPKGWKKKATLPYWAKVRKILQKGD